MPAVELFQRESQDLYNFDDIIRMRRTALRAARSLPIGSERNQHRQVAMSLGALVRNADWVKAHVRPVGSGWQTIESAPYNLSVELAVIDEEGLHALVFPCRRIVAGWADEAAKTRVFVRPTHWREWGHAEIDQSP